MVLWQGLFTDPAELVLPPPNRNWIRLKPCMLPPARRAATRLASPRSLYVTQLLLLLILLRRRLLIWLLRSSLLLLLLHLLLEQLLSLQFL